MNGSEARREAEERALARCADLTARSRSNFYWAFLPLPRERRHGIFAVYAFCREVDDLVDEPEPGVDPRHELDRWRARIDRLGAEDLEETEPVALALAATHRRFTLHPEDLHAVIDGMEMDLDRRRYRDHDDLALYCRRVAGHVGCLCLPIFGCDGEQERDFAMKLGHAFQLTNILRDVGRDAADGRLYLPLEDLALHGVSERDVLDGTSTPRLRRLLRHEGELARRLFGDAAAALPGRSRHRLYSASIMAAIYRRLLEDLMANGPDIEGSRRARVPRRVKVLLALGVLLRDRVLRLA